MTTRESIARYTDHTTGDVVCKTKLKPVDATARGIHTIQLFDKDNTLVKEIESENFISKNWDDIQKQIAKFALMTNNFSVNSYDGIALNNNSNKTDSNRVFTFYRNFRKLFGTDFAPTSFETPFSWMVLSTDDAEESPTTERYLKGDVLGYAQREVTYSGADKYLGSFNAADSTITDKHVKFVWDFPTHAGNGVIKSLVWNRHEAVNTKGILEKWRTKIESPIEGVVFTSGDTVSMVGNKLYIGARDASDSYSRYILEYTFDIATREIKFVKNLKLKGSYSTINYITPDPINEGGFFINTSSTIYRIDSEGSSIQMGVGPSPTSSYMNGYGVFIKDNVIYVRTNTTSDSKIMGYNLTDNSLVMPLHTPDGVSSNTSFRMGIDIPGFATALKFNTTWYFYDSMVNAFKSSNAMPRRLMYTEDTPSYTYYSGGFPIRDTDGELCFLTAYLENDSTSQYMSFFISPIGFIGGRNLLPSPIEKTAEYTMKVTYDLYFE